MTIQQWSSPRLANVETSGSQGDGDVTVLANGNLIVTWEDTNTGNVLFRMFDAAGDALTDEIVVDQIGFDTRRDPSIAALSDGGFVISFESTNGSSFSFDSVIFDANGAVVETEGQSATLSGTTFTESFSVDDEVWVVSDRNGDIGLWRNDSTGFLSFSVLDPGPSEAADGVQLIDGNVAIAWENSSNNQIEYQIVDNTGASILPGGNPLTITFSGSTPGHEPTLAALNNGGFVIVHRTFNATFPGDNADVIAHIVRPDGVLQAVNIFIDPSNTSEFQENYTVVGLADGGFMVVWGVTTDENQLGADISSIYARTFDGLGNATSSRMLVAENADANYGADIEAALMADGRVAVTWFSSESDLDGDGDGVFYSIIDPRNGEVDGTDSDDVLFGSIGDDNVHGRDGADEIDALAGNDYVDAGLGDDRVEGGDGDDFLFGRSGVDELLGGDDNDYLEGGAGGDILHGGNGRDIAGYLTSDGGIIANLRFNVGVSNDAEGDTYFSIEDVHGSNFNDIIRGTTGANELHGAGGSDQLLGDDGDDMLFGGRGNDILRGGGGADMLVGGTGFDVADYTDSASRVLVNLFFGNALEGDAQGDTLFSVESVFGSAFNDIIRGTNGSNALRGNGGNDILRGDGGADLFQYADTNWGNDLIEDFTDGVDQLDLRGSGLAFGDLTITTSGSDTFVSITAVPSSAILLDNFVGTITAADFIF